MEISDLLLILERVDYGEYHKCEQMSVKLLDSVHRLNIASLAFFGELTSKKLGKFNFTRTLIKIGKFLGSI